MNCEPCANLKRQEWLGRLAAESYVATATRFVLLTYDDDHVVNGVNLPEKHIKRYMEKLRKRYVLKHFTVGEYGEKTGRPHWHSLQFYYGAVPAFPLNVGLVQYGWGKGTSEYQLPISTAACCKYIYDYVDKGGKALRPSPGIGKQYLLNYARMRARNRRFLTDKQGIRFTVPNARKPNGGLWNYYFPSSHHWAGCIAEAYLEEWELTQPDECPDRLEGINYG